MKYSIAAIAWILTAFTTYLLVSLAISIIGDFNYRAILCDQHQIIGLVFIYWWLPAAFIAGETYDFIDSKY